MIANDPSQDGNIDVYMDVTPAKHEYDYDFDDLPYLKEDDALLSDTSHAADEYPPYKDYNCWAWSGGITNYCVEPHNWGPWVSGEPWEVDEGDLKSFDNYYLNREDGGAKGSAPRYAGAWNYVRTDINDPDVTIDLWKWNFNDVISHASVRKPGNGYPHGYDWESKMGEQLV